MHPVCQTSSLNALRDVFGSCLFRSFLCMPQKIDCALPAPHEGREFKLMLKNINLIYLGAQVLCMIDRSYLGRFWTQCA